ncbi:MULTISPECIES: hypothetical protein [unclassified Moorena]|uniref:AEC family transporter n=1 Tax=unclassified Moorena TaxID=2683338 RepID=UPI0013B6EA14|nr:MULTISPECIES: hypothetical protein [unclassified Moorena]NEP35511.1 hypothetical protein [Moorena sp. SIO3B2]NEQ10629.1 hypothetical protein [Moorena sp. SIO4E2]
MAIDKVIPLVLFIAIGYALKGKFQKPVAVGAIKTLIINALLPAALFLSTIKIDISQGLLSLPAFGLAINVFLLGIGWLLTGLVIPSKEKAKARSLILMFASLAPGLTVYPFTQEFLGEQGLALAGLMDVGNKCFVLIGLYGLAMYLHQRSVDNFHINFSKFKRIGLTLIQEPANLALLLGLSIGALNLGKTLIPEIVLQALQRLAACTTPMILFFVGISLKPKTLQLRKILLILLVRSAVGFWFSAAVLILFKPDTLAETLLAVVLPQSGCSLWPLLYASQINMLDQEQHRRTHPTFDTEFALGLLTTSIPISIAVNLIIFSNSEFFISPSHLGLVGSILLILFSIAKGINRESGIGNRESGIGKRESGRENRE